MQSDKTNEMEYQFKSWLDEYRIPLVFSIAGHIILLVLLLIHPTAKHYRAPHVMPASTQVTQKQQPKIVNAVAVDQAAVDKQLHAIKAAQAKKQAQEAAHIKRLQQQALAAKRARLAEQKRLSQLKAAQEREKKQQQAAKQARVKEQQRLTQLKAEQKKLKQQQAAALAAKKKALEKQMQQQQLKKEQEMLASQEMQGIINRYVVQIRQAIHDNWTTPPGADPNLKVTFAIDLAPGGTVVQAKITQSSGNSTLDQSAITAIYKASPLPVPSDPKEFNSFHHFTLSMNPG